MAKVKEICERELSDIVAQMGYELVEVAYVKEGSGMSLIFTIDSDKGVTVDDCELVSKKLDPLLDELNPTEDKPYTLVVSSPGLDRPLKTERDFKRNLGKQVEITLFAKQNGKKNFVGVLQNFDDKSVVIVTDKETLTFEKSKIGSVKLVIKF